MFLLINVFVSILIIIVGAVLYLSLFTFIFPEIIITIVLYLLLAFQYEHVSESFNNAPAVLAENQYFNWFHATIERINTWHTVFIILFLVAILLIYVLLSNRMHLWKIYPIQIIGQGFQSIIFYLILYYNNVDFIWTFTILVPVTFISYVMRSLFFEKFDLLPELGLEKLIKRSRFKKKSVHSSIDEEIERRKENYKRNSNRKENPKVTPSKNVSESQRKYLEAMEGAAGLDYFLENMEKKMNKDKQDTPSISEEEITEQTPIVTQSSGSTTETRAKRYRRLHDNPIVFLKRNFKLMIQLFLKLRKDSNLKESTSETSQELIINDWKNTNK